MCGVQCEVWGVWCEVWGVRCVVCSVGVRCGVWVGEGLFEHQQG